MTPPPKHTTPVDLVLFGVGRWGTHLLRNLLAHPQVCLRAVVDASTQRLQTLKAELDSSVELLSDWQAAMALDAVHACV
ncbi:MAG: hypothetical protein AAF528_13400, partial [Cyanobacteria bacterium P01_C01_bin.121]